MAEGGWLWLTVGELSALFLRAKTGEDAAGLRLFQGRAMRWFSACSGASEGLAAARWCCGLRGGGFGQVLCVRECINNYSVVQAEERKEPCMRTFDARWEDSRWGIAACIRMNICFRT